MDTTNYEYKYRKYKLKYKKLKYSFTHGGVFNDTLLDSVEPGIIANTGDIICPIEFPYLCTKNSKSIGLCKEKPEDCNDISIYGTKPNIEQTELGKQYGYSCDHHQERCIGLKKVCLNEYKDVEINTSLTNISICTYNVMGMYRPCGNEEKKRFLDETFQLRAIEIKRIILKHKPTIVCLQEVSKELYDFINDAEFRKTYTYSYEENFCDKFVEEIIGKRKKDIEVHIFSQIPATKIEVYEVPGMFDYTNSLIVADFGIFTIFNCYMQAGSKKSPGQETVWYHYSRCRQDEFNDIIKLTKQYTNPIIVGDFNCHLDGPISEWNELKELKLKTFNKNEKEYEFIDCWKELNKSERGFTENTDINTMRWNYKFIEKQLRYDGVLYKNTSILQPIQSNLIGTTGIELEGELNELFRKFMVRNDETLIKYKDTEKKTFELFPSDHFGVIIEFKITHIDV